MSDMSEKFDAQQGDEKNSAVEVKGLPAFDFQGHEVRFLGTADRPEWVALDIVGVLHPQSDPRNRANYLKPIPAKWLSHKKIMVRSKSGVVQEREVTTLLEPGLYRMLSRTSSPVAEPFQDWLFEDALPKIRRTGLYADTSRFSEEEYERIQQVVADRDVRIAQLEGEAAVKMELLRAQEVHWTDRKNRRSSAIDLADRGKFTIELTGSFDRSIKLKDSVRVWMESKYSRTGSGKNAKWRAVYSLKHEFESSIGYVTFGVLTLWLEEWGWNLRPYSTLTLDGTHGYEVFVCLR